jgi:hypothetical protein
MTAWLLSALFYKGAGLQLLRLSEFFCAAPAKKCARWFVTGHIRESSDNGFKSVASFMQSDMPQPQGLFKPVVALWIF